MVDTFSRLIVSVPFWRGRKLGNLGGSVSKVFNSEFSILHYTQNGKLGDENLGVLVQAFLPNSEFFQFRVFHFALYPNGKLGVGNLRVFSKVYQNSDFFKNYFIKLRGFPTPSFPFCTTLKTENSEMENLGV